MLKSFIINQGISAIEIEEKYERFVSELRTDRYVTVGVSLYTRLLVVNVLECSMPMIPHLR